MRIVLDEQEAWDLDSEWHGLMECELGVQARRRFVMHSKSKLPSDVRAYLIEHRTEARALVRLVALARTDVTILDGLPRMVTEVQDARARVFRSLASRGSMVLEP